MRKEWLQIDEIKGLNFNQCFSSVVNEPRLNSAAEVAFEKALPSKKVLLSARPNE